MKILTKHYYSRENTVLGRQRLVFFEVTALCSIALTVATLFYQPKSEIVLAIDAVCVAVTLGLLILYTHHYLNVSEVSNILYILLQVEICAQMLYLCADGSGDTAALVLQDAFLSLLLIMISIVACLRYTPIIISVLSLLTYVACMVITHSATLGNFLPIYLVVLVGVVIYESVASANARHLQAENQQIKKELFDFMRITGLSLDDMKGITSLSEGSAAKKEKTRELLNQMDARVRDNIVGGVLAVKAQNDSSRETLMAAFSNLTPTQISICQLILQDKKLSEICRILGKTENNISAQRSKIRASLELSPQQQLKEALQLRLNLYHQSAELEKNVVNW